MRHRFFRRPSRVPLAILSCVVVALVACGRDASEADRAETGVVSFSIPAPGSSRATLAAWRPILADMASATGLRIKPYVSGADSVLVEAMRHGRTDAGLFSNEAALQTVRRADGEVFARTVAADGIAAETSVLVVNAKHPVSLARILRCDRTLTIGFGDGLSIPERLAPLAYLFAPRDIAPRTCFKAVRRASPRANLLAVSEGRLDVATADSASMTPGVVRDQPDVSSLRVIWRSPPLPTEPVVWRRNLDPAIKERLRQFLLTYGQGEGAEAARQRADLARIGVSGFAPADDSHLLPMREMEAAEAWVQAKASRNPARIADATQALDEIRVERQALEGRTRTSAADQ